MKNKVILIQFLIISMLFLIPFYTIYADNSEFLKGLDYYQKGEFELARVHFEEAKSINPTNATTYFYLGNTYYQLKDIDNAILNYTKGLDFTDKKGPFFYNLGNCYFIKKNYDIALEMYKKAIEYDPTIFDAYLNAGNAYYLEKKYDKTIQSWQTYLDKYPKAPQYDKIKKAIAYLKQEMEKLKEQKASDESKKATEKNTPVLSEEGKNKENSNLLNEVMGDLNQIIKQTENIMETSEAPINDLSSEDIER